MRSLAAVALALLAVGVVAGTAGAHTAAKAPTSTNSCRVIAVGNLGGAGSTGQTNVSSAGTAGGVALGANAFGGVTITCFNYADGLTITAPGHTFSSTATVRCGGPCSNTSCRSAGTSARGSP